MEITVKMLRDSLREYEDEQPVRLMTQRSYPMQSLLYGVASKSDLARHHDEAKPSATNNETDGDLCNCEEPVSSPNDAHECLLCGGYTREISIPITQDIVYLLQGESPSQWDKIDQSPYGDKDAWDSVPAM